MKDIKEKGFLSSMSSHEPLLEKLFALPHKISCHRDKDVDGIAQMVLHEISHDTSLDMQKISFFVDNPDFDCLKGVAGYSLEESSHVRDRDPWQHPKDFIKSTEKSEFYSSVKKFLKSNIERAGAQCSKKELAEIGKNLGMKSPQIHTWPMRHGNHGVLIFEEGDQQMCKKTPAILDKITALLGLCSV